MKIYLFLTDKIKSYLLPDIIEGSYSFYNIDDSKLINIEARDNKWTIYSTRDSKIINGSFYVESTELKDNTYYVLKNDDMTYLIYITNIKNNDFLKYSYNKDINLIIGTTSDSSIIYNNGLIKGVAAKICYIDDILSIDIENAVGFIYLNNIVIRGKQPISIGDKINIAGLMIIFMRDFFLISNIPENLQINDSLARISKYSFPTSEKIQFREIKDRELYSEKSYFSKSPRIRRIIKTKEIKLSPPPSKSENNELPLILTIGPMLTMGITSGVMLTDVLIKINNNTTTWEESWATVVSSSAMLVAMIVWPLVTNIYNKYYKKAKRRELIEKYSKYLDEKGKELQEEARLQKEILFENLITVYDCARIIQTKDMNFWDKRIDQSDFLVVRIGIGKELLDVKVEYPKEGFTVEEDELRKQADKLVADYKYIEDVPIGYSLAENKITAIMGYSKEKCNYFIDNIILQLLAFYSYEDLKIVIFTNENNKLHWEYLKYLNHTFSNDKTIRFFSTNVNEAKIVSEYLAIETKKRISINHSDDNQGNNYKPHYLIITDDYDMIKKSVFLNDIEETKENLGFSVLLLEQRMSKLPSKCNNFIILNQTTAQILKNSYESQEQITFKEEIIYNINMMEVAKICSNVPIEFEDGLYALPNAVSFLEMEQVGKVEQLNILDRWQTNDTTSSLKAEVGIGEDGEVMYLDLHEKYHGPHGLIAGTTGSGKSEFIITYVLSMCINYSPEDVAFILIDYKGGGLALAFENKATGISLPHLAGTITNLDKAEMDRTLVSIDSEVKRRQKLFNAARDKLEESTIDIYKYQRFYKEGKLDLPIPHLFIICDEFAELKSQQPEFMDNLISVARIGRSLGVHLILATQKPSGVVNDQIWSNTKFRVCLKVQDESDSKEMLKRPEAAYITQVGRYYLQVGYDEIFALGQSAYCGAKYYPSDTIVKEQDKSINFINNCGQFIKNIKATTNSKKEANGEQLQAVIKLIIDVANKENLKTNRLWLDNIPNVILIDNLENKYNLQKQDYHPVAIIGEYDAPEKQEQGIVKYDYLENGNTLIYGNDGAERELLLNAIIYSTFKNYTSEEVNMYIVDYGSESLRVFQDLPQMGNMVFMGEDEKFNNLLKMIRNELQYRKKLFINYGGEYTTYIRNSTDKLPINIVIFNNYDSIFETNQNLYDDLPDLVRDSDRYGIIYIFTCGTANSVGSKISQNFHNIYSFELKDSSDYNYIFNTRTKREPRNIMGRGLLNNDGIHEFQTANIVENENELNEYLAEFINNQKVINQKKAKRIPILPKIIRLDDVKDKIGKLDSIPIGISKNDLEVITYDFTANIGNVISSNKLANTYKFILSLLEILNSVIGTNLIVIDSVKTLNLDTNIYKNYFNNEFDMILDKINQMIESYISNKMQVSGIVLIYGVDKFLAKLNDRSKFDRLLKNAKKYEKISIIIVEDTGKLKLEMYNSWFTENFVVTDGIWIGKGVADSLFKIATISKELLGDMKNNMGFFVLESMTTKIKLIDFISKEETGDNNE